MDDCGYNGEPFDSVPYVSVSPKRIAATKQEPLPLLIFWLIGAEAGEQAGPAHDHGHVEARSMYLCWQQHYFLHK
jgi:hypothetical protein